MKWNKTTYAKELKKGYWDIEPHFYYYSQIKIYSMLKTIYLNVMTVQDFKSAMYGEFVKDGKPILSGFYDNMNFMSKFLKEIIKKTK